MHEVMRISSSGYYNHKNVFRFYSKKTHMNQVSYDHRSYERNLSQLREKVRTSTPLKCWLNFKSAVQYVKQFIYRFTSNT